MKNYYLRSIFFANGIFTFAAMLVSPIFAFYLEGLSGSLISISITSTFFMVSTAFFLVLMSMIGDRLPHKSWLIVVGYLIRSIVWILYIFVTSIEQIYFLQIFLGLADAIGNTSFDVSVAEHLEDGKHVENYSTWKLIVAVGSGLAAITGGFIVDISSFKVLFLIMSLLCIIASIIFIRFRINYSKLKQQQTLTS